MEVRFIAPGEGVAVIDEAAGDMTLKLVDAGGEGGAGSFLMFDRIVPPQSGGPKYVHRNEDKTFYVAEGSFAFQVGDHDFDAPAGSVVLVPRGTPHRLKNVGRSPGRLLVIFRPAGFEKFLEEAGDLRSQTFEGVVSLPALAKKYGVEIL